MMPIVFCASFVPCASENSDAGDELPEPEAAGDRPGPQAADDPVGDEDRDRRAATNASTGATSAGDDDLVDEPVALDRAGARGDERRARDAADQRVRRARRQAGVPGDEVPGDRADEAGEDDRRA